MLWLQTSQDHLPHHHKQYWRDGIFHSNSPLQLHIPRFVLHCWKTQHELIEIYTQEIPESLLDIEELHHQLYQVMMNWTVRTSKIHPDDVNILPCGSLPKSLTHALSTPENLGLLPFGYYVYVVIPKQVACQPPGNHLEEHLSLNIHERDWMKLAKNQWISVYTFWNITNFQNLHKKPSQTPQQPETSCWHHLSYH